MVAEAVEDKEPIWKGIVSWQVGLAIVAVTLYFVTIINPDKVPSVAPNRPVGAVDDLTLLSESVLDDMNKREPQKLLAAGKKDAALSAAEKEVKAHPYDVRSLMSAGNCYCDAAGDGAKDAGGIEKGIAYLRKSVALCPQSRYVRLNVARHLVKANKLEDAVTQYELLDKSTSEEWTAPRIELAELYLTKNETAKAVDELRKVMQNDTKNGAAQERLGLAMARNNDDKEGFEEFNKGYAIRQMNNQLWELNAYVGRFGNDKGKAEEDLQKLVKDNPENRDYIILLGELYLSENKTQAAKDLLATN